MSNEDVAVRFTAETSGAAAGIQNVTRLLEGFHGQVSEMLGPLKELGEAILLAFAVEKIAQFTEHVADLGLQIERTSQQLAISTEKVSLYNYAAEISDVNTSQFRHSVERLTGALEEGAKGGNKQAQAFAMLGVNARDFIKSGGTTEELIKKIGDGTNKLADSTNLSGVYMAMMGRQGADMIPVFEKLSGNMEEMEKEAKATGTVMSENMVRGIAETREGMIHLSKDWDGLTIAVVNDFKPAIDGAVLGMSNLVEGFTDGATHGGIIQGVIIQLSGAMLGLETVVIELISFFDQLFSGLESGLGQAYARVITWSDEMMSLVHGNLEGAKQMEAAYQSEKDKMWKAAGDKSVEADKETTKKLGKLWDDYFARFNSGGDKGGGGGKKKIPSLTGGGSSYDEIAKKEVEAYVAKLSAEQELDKGHYDLVMQLEMLKLAKLKNFYGEDSKQYQDELRKKYSIDQEYMKKAGEGYREFFSKMKGTYNSFISGLMSGTETWRSAFMKALNSIVTGFLQTLPKMIHGWILSEQIKTASTVAGTAARTAAETAGAKAAGASKFAAAIKDIKTDVVKTYAGVYGFFSPVLGPFAAIPAAAAAAIVGGMEALIPAYEQGTAYVPQTGPALLHKGERVLTADENKSFGGGAGGIHVHMHGNAYGFQDFQQAVRHAVKSAHRNMNRGFS